MMILRERNASPSVSFILFLGLLCLGSLCLQVSNIQNSFGKHYYFSGDDTTTRHLDVDHHRHCNETSQYITHPIHKNSTPAVDPRAVLEQNYTYSSDDLLVQPGDFVYLRGDWDGSPIVIESHKLVFFTQAKVGCTVWKMLARRMMGQKDWKTEGTRKWLPWNPELNGLKYLYDFANRSTASEIMTSPEWTRAIFVRDPKERFLSAYLDKAVGLPEMIKLKCCKYTGTCAEYAKKLDNFFDLVQTCDDSHWRPQGHRMESKYWPYINFVGHLETITSDAERLLRRVGAWQDYGQSGWGPHGNLSVFFTSDGRHHATNAKDRLRSYYTADLERRVEDFYVSDYSNPVLNITRVRLFDEKTE